jgi:predicted RNase H-like HicB family nuclease
MSIRENVDEEMSGKRLKLSVVVHKDELDGGFIAECLDIPGCISQGETETEANQNLADAVTACITVMIEGQLKRTPLVRFATEMESKRFSWLLRSCNTELA